MKSRALTKQSKYECYTKNGRKNVTSDRCTTKCELRTEEPVVTSRNNIGPKCV